MHMHTCKTQALVVSASGLKAMACTEIEAHLYKIAFENSICQLHTLQRCRAWVVVQGWGCQPGAWAVSSASLQVYSLSLGHFSFLSLFPSISEREQANAKYLFVSQNSPQWQYFACDQQIDPTFAKVTRIPMKGLLCLACTRNTGMALKAAS